MPDLGYFHPIAIHFAIALLSAGVVFRWTSMTGRVEWSGPAATGLVLLATVAVLVAARSGEDAHVAVEAFPGLGDALHAHQRWGAWTRDLTVVLGGLELATLVGRGRRAAILSALVGMLACGAVLQTGRLGGALVYAHAGGVGIRSGAPDDVAQLLLAGLFAQADLDRKAGRPGDAAELLGIAARRFPDDAAVQVLDGEVLLEDRSAPAAALAVLEHARPEAFTPLRFHQAWLMADALDALGRPAEARAVLEQLRSEFPASSRLRARLERPAPGGAQSGCPSPG